jgi:hypothetical protein
MACEGEGSIVSVDQKKSAPFGAAQTLQTASSLPVLVHVLRHLKVMLQGW